MGERCASGEAPTTRTATERITPLPVAERCLTEVDNLNRHRLPDGTHSPEVLEYMLPNYVTGVAEGGMPSAIPETFQEYVKGFEDNEGARHNTFVWLGRTALQVAQSGRKWYHHEAALRRGDVEEDAAKEGDRNLQPGIIQFMVAPKMSEKDAPSEVAEAEGLAEQDSIQASWIEVDNDGNVKGKHLHSLLVKDIPLEAWVDWLADPSNPFGEAIEVEDPQSALAVMQVFRKLRLGADAIPAETHPLLYILESVVPYIKDPDARQSLKTQIIDFREDQAGKHQKALNIARRWLDFDKELADSLYNNGEAYGEGVATKAIEAFVYQMSDAWSEDDAALIRSLQINGTQKIRMTRELAVRLAEAQRKLRIDAASVVTNNRDVLKQLDAETAARIRANELEIQRLYDLQQDISRLQATNNRAIASLNLINGGGCPGKSTMRFADEDPTDLLRGLDPSEPQDQIDALDRKNWKRKQDKCVVESCPTRPAIVEVGPCGVCMKRCQKIYDKGGDPTEGIVIKTVISETASKSKPETDDSTFWPALLRAAGSLATASTKSNT